MMAIPKTVKPPADGGYVRPVSFRIVLLAYTMTAVSTVPAEVSVILAVVSALLCGSILRPKGFL